MGVIAAGTVRDKQDMLQGVGQWPVDTAEEAAVRRRRRRRARRGKRGGGRRMDKLVGGGGGGGAAHCGGQSALTATGVAEWYLSRLDRWTDRATPGWKNLAPDAGARARPDQHTHRHDNGIKKSRRATAHTTPECTEV